MKLIIWDLDNTLVEGVLVEGEVKIKDTSREALKQISKLKIKNIICSKNDKGKLIEKLKEFDLMKYIDDVYASFEPKHYAVKDILEKYNLNPYEVLFVDDETINRKEVGYLTKVHTDFEEIPLMILKYFDTDRLILQLQQQKRIEEEHSFKGDFKDFVEQSKLKVEIRRANYHDFKRIVTLCNRTNDYNASRNRYTEPEVRTRLESISYRVYIAEASDRYGNYGKIGEAIILRLPGDIWFIEDLAISCRVWNRGIGKKLLNYIIEQARIAGIVKIRGIIRLNEDNKSMTTLYQKLGFESFKKSTDKANTINYELIIRSK